MVFAYLPREAQRQVNFLYDPLTASAPKSIPIPRRDLFGLEGASQPVHFIFHTGYCCSTLLCRALDLPGVSMAAKEPQILQSFSGPMLIGERDQIRNGAMASALDLLARPLSAGEVSSVKATFLDLLLIDEVARARPSTKILMLYGPMDEFLRSVARRGLKGRTYMRHIFGQISPTIGLRTGLTTPDLFRLGDLQMAALTWMMMVARMDRTRAALGGARVRTLRSDQFLGNKALSLTRLGKFWDLNAPGEKWEEVANGQVFRQHAKGERLFDEVGRRADQERTSALDGPEIQEVLVWIDMIKRKIGFGADLGCTLLD